MADISDKTQQHLSKVYWTLMMSTGFFVVGMLVNSIFLVTGICFFMIVTSMMMIFFSSVSNHTLLESERIGALWTLALFAGLWVVPIIQMIDGWYFEILMQAGKYTIVSFFAFSAAALYSKRKSWLFLKAYVFKAVSTYGL